jgi:hypothetical protein
VSHTLACPYLRKLRGKAFQKFGSAFQTLLAGLVKIWLLREFPPCPTTASAHPAFSSCPWTGDQAAECPVFSTIGNSCSAAHGAQKSDETDTEDKKVLMWRRIPIPTTVHSNSSEGSESEQDNTPVAELIFTNQAEMDRILHPISDAIEGKVYKREGHNFSFEAYLNAHPPASFAPLTDLLRSVGTRYVIAYLEGDIPTKRHELRHAMFHIDEGYRQSTTSSWDALPPEDQVCR